MTKGIYSMEGSFDVVDIYETEIPAVLQGMY